jgi:hypothetical protein
MSDDEKIELWNGLARLYDETLACEPSQKSNKAQCRIRKSLARLYATLPSRTKSAWST